MHDQDNMQDIESLTWMGDESPFGFAKKCKLRTTSLLFQVDEPILCEKLLGRIRPSMKLALDNAEFDRTREEDERNKLTW